MNKPQVGSAIAEIESVTITEFKARAREVIDRVSSQKPVAIMRHSTPDAVLISADDYAEFVHLKRERLNFLTERYDEMVARMQTPESAAGVDALFNATSEQLGSVALAAAKRG